MRETDGEGEEGVVAPAPARRAQLVGGQRRSRGGGSGTRRSGEKGASGGDSSSGGSESGEGSSGEGSEDEEISDGEWERQREAEWRGDEEREVEPWRDK